MSKASLRTFALFALLFQAGASAQDLPGVGSGAQDAPENANAPSPWIWFGDLLLRANRTEDIPRPVEPSFTHAFARGRFGVAWDPIPTLEFGAAIKLAAAGNSNDDDRASNVEERSNDIALDQAYLRWRAGESAVLLLGKAPLPLPLSPMLWDTDLRPIGASVDVSLATGEYDRLQLSGGWFAGDLPYGDQSRIGAIQAAWHWREGAPVNGSVLLSYLDFSDLGQLVRQGFARTNRRVGTTTRLVSDYRLLDLQLVGHARVAGLPFEARLDFVRNLGADDQNDGARASIVLGDSRRPGGWEFGAAAQRIQRDAVLAAFNSDEWWFHSWTRGVMPWIGYGFNATWSTRLAAFHERRDGVDEYTDRILLDVYARW
jgi:hypothetical protein